VPSTGTWARRGPLHPLHPSRYARAPADRAESLDGITLRDRTIRENARRAAVMRVGVCLGDRPAPHPDLAILLRRLPSRVWGSVDGTRHEGTPADFPDYVDPAVDGAVAFLRDSSGQHWRARPDGQLDQIAPEQVPLQTW
jgi:hypothetical protein